MNIGSRIIEGNLSEEDLATLSEKITNAVSKLLVEEFGIAIDDLGEAINDKDVEFLDNIEETIYEIIEDEFQEYT